LNAIVEEELLRRACELGRIGLERLAAIKARHSVIRDIRGLGAYFGVEIAGSDGNAANARADQLMYACLERGLSFKLGSGNVATLCPPLTIPRDQFDRAFDILDDALTALA
jgi:4-aminobutyrate aminotransferase